MAKLWVQRNGQWCDMGGKLGQRKLNGGTARSPLLWRYARARDRGRARVSARESERLVFPPWHGSTGPTPTWSATVVANLNRQGLIQA